MIPARSEGYGVFCQAMAILVRGKAVAPFANHSGALPMSFRVLGTPSLKATPSLGSGSLSSNARMCTVTAGAARMARQSVSHEACVSFSRVVPTAPTKGNMTPIVAFLLRAKVSGFLAN